MTDITELAQSLKAAADREMICRDVAETSEIWERTVTPENILALVEALEKAQQELENWRTRFDNERFRADKLKAHIDDMEPIRAAAEKLVRCKGRYHSEQNYRALAALFGVNTPDLPPLDGESRTVTVKLPRPGLITISGERTAVYLKDDIDAVLAAAGIKVAE